MVKRWMWELIGTCMIVIISSYGGYIAAKINAEAAIAVAKIEKESKDKLTKLEIEKFWHSVSKEQEDKRKLQNEFDNC